MDRDLPALRTGETLASSLSRLRQRFHDTAGRLAARAQLELTEDAGATIPVAVTAGRRRADIDEGVEPNLTAAEAKRITGLEQESRELRRPSTRYREFSWSTCGRGASRSSRR